MRYPPASRLVAPVLFLLVTTLAPRAAAEEWHEAYRNGITALARGNAARAVELFERAIQKRPEPGRNVVTYGTNVEERYYPYVRLAEAYLLLGNVEGAREALRRSEARGKEPAEERARLSALLAAADEKSRPREPPASSTPPPYPSPTSAARAEASPAPTPADTPAPGPASTLPSPGLLAGSSALPAGTLELGTDPPGATAWVGSRRLGKTPLTAKLPPGEHEVVLRRDGASPISLRVRIGPGERTSVTRDLLASHVGHPDSMSPAPSEAPSEASTQPASSLVISSDPPGASVYLDDEPMGSTDPVSGRWVKSGVAPGRHQLRLSAPRYVDLLQELEVGASGPTQFRGALSASPATDDGRTLAALALLVFLGALAVSAWVWRRRSQSEAEMSALQGLLVRGTGGWRRSRTPTGRTPVAPTPPRTPPTTPRSLPEGGERFGEYVLVELLGRGGMAAVYRAERRGEVCALKRPLATFLEDAEFLERFLREAEIGRTLHHPNIVRILDRGEVDRTPYFTMELVRGETLHALLRRSGALEPRRGARLVAEVAEALDYAHHKGVIHRDLKPSNVMVSEQGQARVMDYGIARARRFEGLTLTGAFLGTPEYVAPETIEGGGADARSDLYSLGIVLYEVLTGRRPFAGDVAFVTLREQLTRDPVPPSALNPAIPPELEAIVLRLLRKDPGKRHAAAEDLLLELREYLNRAA